MEISKEVLEDQTSYRAGKRIFFYRGPRLFEVGEMATMFRCLVTDEEHQNETGVLSFLLVEEAEAKPIMLIGKTK